VPLQLVAVGRATERGAGGLEVQEVCGIGGVNLGVAGVAAVEIGY